MGVGSAYQVPDSGSGSGSGNGAPVRTATRTNILWDNLTRGCVAPLTRGDVALPRVGGVALLTGGGVALLTWECNTVGVNPINNHRLVTINVTINLILN